MLTRAALTLVLFPLCACKPAEESRMKAIVGAVLIDGEGGPPVSNSVVVVAGDRIRASGAGSTVPIPAEADKIDGSGKFLVPGLVEVSSGVRISSLAEVESQVKNGVSAFVGMIRDTENLDPEFLSTLRNLQIVFAPALSTAGDRLEVAKRNTRRLFQAGVPIALASDGHDAQREIELLQDAGLPPLDAIVAATRNGTIQPGKPANLLLLSANPGEDVRNLRRVALRMVNGEWVP
jgi:imidazolonepropionase-like amidohydrolase